MKYQEGVARTLIIIAVFVFIVILASVVYFVYWQDGQEVQELVVVEEVVVIEEPAIIEEEKVPDFDYKDLDILSSIMPCYLNDNPRDMRYFPEGRLRAFFNHISKNSKIKDLDCETYDFEEVDDYVASLLETDNDNDGLNLYLENIYHTDDNKQDSDDDGYDDLVEINNNYNPNNFNSLLSGLDFYYNTEDELVYNPEDDEDSDEPVDEEDDGGSGEGDEDDGGSINPPQVDQINEPADCLGLAAGDIDQCLGDFVESTGSLEPCMLSEDFNRCVANASIFRYISSSAECHQYQDFMNVTNFDKCLSTRSLVENDINICFELQESQPLGCINNLVDLNEDLDLCAYVYFLQASINSTDGWQDHKSCINRVYTSEPQVEQQAVSGCESIDMSTSDSAILYKMLCFVNLAVAYNDIDYCTSAAMIDGEMNQSTMDNCASKLSQ